jgi:E3 ubiquitin-protein ligase MARCH5
MEDLNRTNSDDIVAANEEIDRILSISLAEKIQQQQRYCWVCFATEDDEEEGSDKLSWVKPCNCKGTLKWVHQSCLLRWIDEKQKGNSFKRVSCQQCQTEYIIVLPQMGLVSDLLEGLDNVIRRSSPFLAAGVFVGSFYWASVTYGAITSECNQLHSSSH